MRGASQVTDIVLKEERGTIKITELLKAECERVASQVTEIILKEKRERYHPDY